jgi:hypothetical protein
MSIIVQSSQLNVKMSLKHQKRQDHQPGTSIREVKSLHYTTVKIDQFRGFTVALTKTSCLGFEHIEVNT